MICGYNLSNFSLIFEIFSFTRENVYFIIKDNIHQIFTQNLSIDNIGKSTNYYILN